MLRDGGVGRKRTGVDGFAGGYHGKMLVIAAGELRFGVVGIMILAVGAGLQLWRMIRRR